MGKNVKKKKVSYLIGVNLDGPVYCDHDLIEVDEKSEEQHSSSYQGTVDSKPMFRPAPRPNLRQMPHFSKPVEKKDNGSSKSNKK